jgi:NADH:ubiquinone oxidoreductase subunit H
MSLSIAEVGYVEATWVMVVKSLIIFLAVFMIVPVLTVAERKLIGRFQNRYGPNRVGPVGLMQPLADIVKLAGKEMFRPQAAVPFLFAIAPAIVIFSGIVTLAILPFGNVEDGSACTGSTSRSASSTSSPSARSRSTGCCSPAGPRARSTASSARCARPPS